MVLIAIFNATDIKNNLNGSAIYESISALLPKIKFISVENDLNLDRTFQKSPPQLFAFRFLSKILQLNQMLSSKKLIEKEFEMERQ